MYNQNVLLEERCICLTELARRITDQSEAYIRNEQLSKLCTRKRILEFASDVRTEEWVCEEIADDSEKVEWLVRSVPFLVVFSGGVNDGMNADIFLN